MFAAMKLSLPLILTFNAGFVDTAGYLALHGLFAAHVTGNFVTFGAAMVLGTSGAVAKLAALPVFCLAVVSTRLLSHHLPRPHLSGLTTFLVLEAALLGIGAALAAIHGPFVDGDSLQELVTGMVLVAAMAIQNTVHRIHLAKAPPTTLMTGTSTQIMIEVADWIRGDQVPADRLAAKARLLQLTAAVAMFAVGCAFGALAIVKMDTKAFVVPVFVAMLTIALVRCARNRP